MTNSQNVGIKKRSAAMRVIGPDAYRFLNGMLTQDIQKSKEKLPAGGRSFIVSPKGKIISPLYFASLTESELLIWSDVSDFENLKDTLNRYLIADKVEIIESGTFESWSLMTSEFSFTALNTRHPLGLERIFPLLKLKGQFILPQGRMSPSHCEVLCLESAFDGKEISAEDFWLESIQVGQPVWGVDLLKEDFILEFPLSDAVSFDKGCYVGQETIARGTFRGKVNKSFTRVRSNKPLTAGTITNTKGEVLGQLRHAQKNLGSALLKLGLESESNFFINQEEHTLEIDYRVNEETYKKGR